MLSSFKGKMERGGGTRKERKEQTRRERKKERKRMKEINEVKKQRERNKIQEEHYARNKSNNVNTIKPSCCSEIFENDLPNRVHFLVAEN
jgi:hypothetical protein